METNYQGTPSRTTKTRVLRVFVASPGDVVRERNTVDKIFNEINQGIGSSNNVLCRVWHWTDAYPEFGPGGPQGAIDRQLPISDCDLLVGIFWKRFGTPTGDAASGTEHEICLAYKAWKAERRPQIMLYFSQYPYYPQTEQPEDELDQWKRVFAFKRKFQNSGLLWSYCDAANFEDALRRHATKFVLDLCNRDTYGTDMNGDQDHDEQVKKSTVHTLDRIAIVLFLVGIVASILALFFGNFSLIAVATALAVLSVYFYFALALYIYARKLLRGPKK